MPVLCLLGPATLRLFLLQWHHSHLPLFRWSMLWPVFVLVQNTGRFVLSSRARTRVFHVQTAFALSQTGSRFLDIEMFEKPKAVFPTHGKIHGHGHAHHGSRSTRGNSKEFSSRPQEPVNHPARTQCVSWHPPDRRRNRVHLCLNPVFV